MDVNVTCFICLHVLSAWTLTIKPNMKRFMIYMTTTGKRAQADARLTQNPRPQSLKKENISMVTLPVESHSCLSLKTMIRLTNINII